MNRFNFKNRIAPLLLGCSLFLIRAADKDALEKQLNATTAQPANKNDNITRSGPEREFVPKTENLFFKTTGFMGQESGPTSYESHGQIGGGLKFITPPPHRALKKNNTHIKTDIVSTKSTPNKDVDENLIEEVLNKYTSGFPLNAVEKAILKDNINELTVVNTTGIRRPSISGQHRISRNASDLFFSEYGDGSGSNKYLEIYNGTGVDVDLNNYLIMQINGGGNWFEDIDTLSGTLANGDVFVIVNSSANANTLVDEGDLTESVITNFNGDDARALIKVVGDDTTFLDYIGSYGPDPGSGWNVAGITNATEDHTLVRKSAITSGNTNWTLSAGTNTTDSEWNVHAQNTWSYLGSHTMTEPNPLSEGFEGGVIPENWNIINNDGNEHSWKAAPSSLWAHTGDYLAKVYYNEFGSDDWLITPRLDVVSGDSIVFWARSSHLSDFEDFNVKISTTTNDNIAAFTGTIASVDSTSNIWTRYAYALDTYTGQEVYVAVQCVTVDGFYLYVDDFSGPQVWIEDSPVFAVSKSTIDFGNTGTGGISASFMISNYGAPDLVISSIMAANPDFTVSSSVATLTGGGNDTETITVTYTPTTTEEDTSYVVLTHNGSSSPDSIKVMGAGKDAIYWQDFESWEAELQMGVPQPPGMTQEGNMTYSYDGTFHANGWEKTASSSVVFSGDFAAEFDSYEGQISGTDTSALITPAIEYMTPTIYTNPPAVEGALRFYMKKLGTEEFYVSYSNDNGASWTKHYSDTTENYITGLYGWKNVSIVVPVGETYIFKFVGRAKRENNLGDVFVDEISFVEVPPTPELSLTYSAIEFMPQVIGDSTTSTAFTAGFNSGSATLVVDSIVTDNEDFSAVLTTMSTGDSVLLGGNVDLDIVWSPTSFGLAKTNAVFFHNADTSPDTIVLSGEAGRSYVSFDGNDNFQGAAFDGDLPWWWDNEDADGDGDSWMFDYRYYGPGPTGDPVGYYARSPGGGNRLQTRPLLPVVGDSLVFYYNSSNPTDNSNLYIKAKRVGDQLNYTTTDTLQFDGGINIRAAIDLSAYNGDTITIRLVDDIMENNNKYHRLDDLLMPAYQISSTGQLVFGKEVMDFGAIHPTTPASITTIVANMGSADLTISSVVSNNTTFSPVLSSSTVLAETATELTVTFSPLNGGVQSGNIIVRHDAPSSPDTLELTGGGMVYLTGTVTDNETEQALDSVIVKIGNGTTYTSNNGEYGDYSVPADLMLIQFIKEGYNNANFNTMLSEGDTITLNAALEPIDINNIYSLGFESGEDQGVSNVLVGTNNFAVVDTHITASGDTVLPSSGIAMLVFPDSGGYENNDHVKWVADSSLNIAGAVGGLYLDLDVNIDTEDGNDFFYFCLVLDDGSAWYNDDNGYLSGSTNGWIQYRIDMSMVLNMGSETATPAIVFSADGDLAGSGGAFDNILVTRNPFFLAPPSQLSAVNYGLTIPLSWEDPVGSGRASYTVGNIDLNTPEPHLRPTILDDGGNMVELVKGPRDYPVITIHHNYSTSSTRSLLGYNIYRVVWPFGDHQLLTYVTGTAYDDGGVSDGSYYQYTVRAVYDEGESGEAGPVSARAGLPVVVTDSAYGGENFEASNFGWDNWETFYSSAAAVWTVGDSTSATSAFGQGGMSAPDHTNFVYLSDGRGGEADYETFLLSPFIDFIDNFTAIVKLSGYARVFGDFADNNIVRLLVRSDMGPWDVAVDFGYNHINGWEDYSASIGDIVSGRDKAQLALHYKHTGGLNSNNGNGVAFDDLVFETIPGPHSLTLTPSTTDITLSWSHYDNITQLSSFAVNSEVKLKTDAPTSGLHEFLPNRDLSHSNVEYNIYRDSVLVYEGFDGNSWVDQNILTTTEVCYKVHGVVQRNFNIGTTVLSEFHETDPSNIACGRLINTPPGQFHLISPEDGEVVIIRPENINLSKLFSWSNSVDPNGSTVTYRAVLEAVVGNEGSFVYAVDTTATYVYVPYQDIADTLLSHTGVEAATFQWTVYSSDQESSIEAENGPYSVTFDVGYMLSNTSEGLLPDVFALHQNYPNPFNPITTIRFDVPKESHVKIDVYNVMGEKVAELVDAYFQPGFYTVNWDGMTTPGSALSSGMYFYRIQARDFTAVKKLLLVK